MPNLKAFCFPIILQRVVRMKSSAKKRSGYGKENWHNPARSYRYVEAFAIWVDKVFQTKGQLLVRKWVGL